MTETFNIVKPLETEAEMEELRKHLNSTAAYYRIPTPYEKLVAKMKENPFLAFLPMGCVATLCALTFGLWSFKNHRGKMAQTMMRLRLVTQSLTLAAVCLGMGIGVKKNN